ncbi:MAG: DNA polymerase I [Deltaproteobacteria bacterium]|nr:DNA polymerase I [Deltaproteobacteria bacterium]
MMNNKDSAGENRETVYLLDGSSYIHRAYHAIRNLSNSKGLSTNAIFGFTRMILKLIDDVKPKYLAVILDSKGPNFRHEIYKDYKANRPPMPEELVDQLTYIKRIIQGLNIVMLEKEGYEADDIIGTLARKGQREGFRVIIVTGDKDFRQLISPQISLWDTMKDKVTDYEIFKEEYALEPEQIIDLMGLSGDSSDNIPGVRGVGEKTALELIREFGSIERVFEHLGDIKKKKLRENLENSQTDAMMSRQLVTIEQFVPMAERIEDLRLGEPDDGTLSELFRELEFKGLWDQFATRSGSATTDYRLCLSGEGLASLVEEIKQEGLVSVDTETTSQDPMLAELVGISFSCEEGKATYLPLGHHYLGAPEQLEFSKALGLLKEILQDENILKIGQNIKYDALVLRRQGIKLQGIHFDTMIASYVINPSLRQHNLDYLAQHYLNHRMMSYKELVGRGKKEVGFSEVDVEKAKTYSCEDADVTLRLMTVLDKRLHSEMNQDLFYRMEMRLLPVLMDMEFAGIKIDTTFFAEMSGQFAEQLQEIEREIFEEVGMEFNINSPQQLGHVLFEKLQLPVQKKTRKTRDYSTDVKVLKKLSSLPHKTPKLLLRYRTLSKLKSTYLDALVKIVNSSTGRIHTSFNQTVTATGRLSSSNPNLQNIPIRGDEGREIRKGFVAEEGHKLLSADYSQVELRVFAHYSRDSSFMQAFERDEDIHAATASEIMGVARGLVTTDMRRVAKAINFGIIYGMGSQRLSEELGIDHKTAKDYIDAYYNRYQGVARYREEMIAMAREKGYVTTLFNRRRYLPDIHHAQQRIRAEAERMAINTPIQGTAADLIKMAMINIHNRLKRENLRSRMVLQVHDELLFEVPKSEVDLVQSMVKEEMEGVHPLDVPLRVDIHIGDNWDEAH